MAAETWWDLYRNGEYWFTTSARSTRTRVNQACEYLSGAEGVPVTATPNGSAGDIVDSDLIRATSN